MSFGVHGRERDKPAELCMFMSRRREPESWEPPCRPAAHFHRIPAAAFWVALLACISARSGAQTPTIKAPEPPPPGVGIQIHAQPKIGTVGDPIQIDLDITTPPGYQVEVPRPVPKTADFAVLEFLPVLAAPGNGKSKIPAKSEEIQHHRARIVIAIYETGKFAFPSIQIPIKTSEGEEISLSSPQVDIEIRSVLADKNPSLKDLKKQVEIPDTVRWALWLGIALALLILCVIVLHFWRRPGHPPSIPLEQTKSLLDMAESELRDLLAHGPPERGMEKQFYISLSEIAKRILESAYTIHTAERTTEEIMDALHGNAFMNPEDAKLIESFLLRCDVVKFARYVPSTIESKAISGDAIQMLEKAKKTAGSRQTAEGSG